MRIVKYRNKYFAWKDNGVLLTATNYNSYYASMFYEVCLLRLKVYDN